MYNFRYEYINTEFDFSNLFILDLANNHQGSLEHSLNIIKTFSKIARDNEIKAGFKFQFRDLPDFVHKNEQKILRINM